MACLYVFRSFDYCKIKHFAENDKAYDNKFEEMFTNSLCLSCYMWHVAAHKGNNEEIRCSQKQEADENVVDVKDAQHSDERFVSNKKHDGIPADVGNIRQMTDDFAQKQKRQNTKDRQQNLLDMPRSAETRYLRR